jgi:hypothetical protein
MSEVGGVGVDGTCGLATAAASDTVKTFLNLTPLHFPGAENVWLSITVPREESQPDRDAEE